MKILMCLVTIFSFHLYFTGIRDLVVVGPVLGNMLSHDGQVPAI